MILRLSITVPGLTAPVEHVRFKIIGLPVAREAVARTNPLDHDRREALPASLSNDTQAPFNPHRQDGATHLSVRALARAAAQLNSFYVMCRGPRGQFGSTTRLLT